MARLLEFADPPIPTRLGPDRDEFERLLRIEKALGRKNRCDFLRRLVRKAMPAAAEEQARELAALPKKEQERIRRAAGAAPK